MQTSQPGAARRPRHRTRDRSIAAHSSGRQPRTVCAATLPSPLCAAVGPVEASSGPRVRHRLNRGSNRKTNNALWRIAMVRLRHDERTKTYTNRHTTEGKTPREIIRCPRALHRPRGLQTTHQPTRRPAVPDGADLRHQRTTHGLTLTDIAPTLNTTPTRLLRTRTRPHTQPQPRTTLPTPPNTPPRKFSKLKLSPIGASETPPKGHPHQANDLISPEALPSSFSAPLVRNPPASCQRSTLSVHI